MQTRPHPTHHDDYRPNRTFWGVVVGVAGVFLCVFVGMVNAEDAPALHALKASVSWAGALAFVGGTLLVLYTEIPHLIARCASCGRRLLRSRMDYRQSYYRCRKCDVTWTCSCSRGTD
jgi:hypothetical protein